MHVRFPKAFSESFGIRVFALFAILISIISFSFTAFFVDHETKSLRNNLVKNGKLLAGTLAYSSRIGVFSENEKLLKDPVRGVFLQEEVLEVSIFNLKGELLKKQESPETRGQEGLTREDGKGRNRILEEIKRSMSPFYLEENDTFEFWSPVISGLGYSGEEALFLGEDPLQRKDNLIGFVRITIDKEILNRRLNGLLLRSILIGIGCLLVGFGVTYLLVTGVTRPLRKLTEGVKTLGMGGKVEKVSVGTVDEIGKLAEAFNHMSESLKKREKALRESEKRLRSLSSELLKAQEKERMRLSKELHDELGQSLALLKHRQRSIQRKLQEGQSSLREECEETIQYIDQTIENVRRLSRDLSPSILEDLGLSAALRWLGESFAKQHSIRMSFEIENIDHLFSQEAQTNLYRISQEALTNIGRHAGANQVSFAVNENGNGVSLAVEDNGKGFDVNQVKARHSPDKGVGLAAMDERARMLGALLDIRSQEGEGTRISLTIPLEREE